MAGQGAAPPAASNQQGGFAAYNAAHGGADTGQTQNFTGNPWDPTYALSAYVYHDNPTYGKRVPRSAVAPSGFVGPVNQGLVPGGDQKYVLDQKTGEQYLQDLSKFSPHDISQLQADLTNLGLLSPDTYRVGDGTDERTMAAMAGVLRVAALKGLSPGAAIEYLQKTTPASQTLEGQKKAAGQSDAQARQKAAYDAYIGEMNSAYLRTWGTSAPPGYVDRAAKAGMNVYEFQAHERSKPAFLQSAQGQTERLNLESQIAQWMGRG